MAKFKGGNVSIELYLEDGKFGLYLADECGGSGVDVKGDTPEEAAAKITPYIADCFYADEEETEE